MACGCSDAPAPGRLTHGARARTIAPARRTTRRVAWLRSPLLAGPMPTHHAARRHGHSDQHESSGRHGHGQHHHGHHHRRRGGQSPWLWAGMAGLGGVIVFVLLQVAGAGSYYDEEAGPERILARAERELEQGQLQRALDSITLAETRKPDDATRQRLHELRTRAKAQQSRSGDEGKLESARKQLAAMTAFESSYL